MSDTKRQFNSENTRRGGQSVGVVSFAIVFCGAAHLAKIYYPEEAKAAKNLVGHYTSAITTTVEDKVQQISKYWECQTFGLSRVISPDCTKK